MKEVWMKTNHITIFFSSDMPMAFSVKIALLALTKRVYAPVCRQPLTFIHILNRPQYD